jgi:hypothetical protein
MRGATIHLDFKKDAPTRNGPEPSRLQKRRLALKGRTNETYHWFPA